MFERKQIARQVNFAIFGKTTLEKAPYPDDPATTRNSAQL
jgi:hypothetical protein